MIDLISRDPAILMVSLTAVAGKWIWGTRVAKRGHDLPAMLASFGVALGGFILKPLSASVLAPKFAMLAQRAPISLTMNDWRVWMMVFLRPRSPTTGSTGGATPSIGFGRRMPATTARTKWYCQPPFCPIGPGCCPTTGWSKPRLS